MFKVIFLKEMKDVLRDKRSITLLIIMPIFMMAALTLFYDKILTSGNDRSFVLAIEEGADPVLVEKLETYMTEVTIKEFSDIALAVEEKEAQIGIQVTGDLANVVDKQESIPVHVYFDPGSQESSAAFGILQGAMTAWEKEAVHLRLADQNIDPSVLEVFHVETKTSKDEDDAIASFMLALLIPLLIPIAIANGSYPSATELFAGEKEKKTMEALLITPVKPVKILLAKWLTISLLGMFTGILCVGVLAGLMNVTTELQKGLSVIENTTAFIAMSLVLIVVFAIFISELEMILSMLANSVKEAGYYITPVLGLLALPMLIMFFSGEAINLGLYTIPVMNLFLFVRDAFNGQLTGEAFAIAVGSYIAISAILFPIAYKLFHNHRLMLGK